MSAPGSSTVTSIEWIAVTDRLPDDDIAALVAFENGETWMAFHEDGRWVNEYGKTLQPVKYWSHLPDGPK